MKSLFWIVMKDKVICIDDVTDILNFGDGIKELTYGKEYEIIERYYQIECDRLQISIINDIGIKNEYRLSRFVTLEEWRENRLKEIGIECTTINKRK